MMRPCLFRTVTCLVAALALAAPAAAFAPNAADPSLEFPLEYDAISRVYPSLSAQESMIAAGAGLAGWVVQENGSTGTVHAAWGGNTQLGAIPSESVADAQARSFLTGQALVTGVRSDNIQLRSARRFASKGLYVVHYNQVLNGIPVHNATAWVLMTESGRVGAFGSDFLPEPAGLPTSPSLTSADAISAAAAALGTTPRSDRPIDAQLVYVPAPNGEVMELTIAWQVSFETDEPFGHWMTTVHGLSGAILARENLFETINVTGDADGDPNNNLPTLSYCDGVTPDVAYGDMTVTVQGGNSAVTDAAGHFDIANAGTSPVTVDAELKGPYVDVQNGAGGADAAVSLSVTPGTPAVISFSSANARQDEMNVYYHTNVIRNFMYGLDNTFTQLDVSMSSTAGNPSGVGFCPGNAWYSRGAITTNYCDESTTYGNTGEMANVIYHEYGHGITEAIYVFRNGGIYPVTDLSEGNSDVIANYLDRNSVIGYGFYLDNCTSGIRDANNTLQWPTDNDGGHFGGQIIAGFHWDAWQSLLGALPQAEADSIAFYTWYLGRDMGTPADQASQVLWTFMADDDDADLTNGTPNYDHFCLAATNHGFSCPAIISPVSIAHERLPHTTNGSAGNDVVATIVSSAAALDPTELKITYHVNGGADVDVPLTATGNPDEYSATIPPTFDQDSEIEYYISAADVDGNTRTSPDAAPTEWHAFDVAMIVDDLEGSTSGWITGGDASTGQWVVGDPIGDAAQPEDDSTPGAGVNAYMTGQCSGGSCGGGCTLGCNDVDNGTAGLGTPVYDLSGAVSAKVKFDRWFSNDQGSAPNTDPWTVRISNDGGTTWTVLETTTTSSPGWTTVEADVVAMFGTPGQVALRFSATDQGIDSVVEAAVDDVRVLADFGGAVDVAETPQTLPLALELNQNQPNPFRPETTIRYALPQAGDVSLVVYDVQGRVVRTLDRGTKESGRYNVRWNGLDNQGARVAAGVYFYRLEAAGQVLTRKMTVLK